MSESVPLFGRSSRLVSPSSPALWNSCKHLRLFENPSPGAVHNSRGHQSQVNMNRGQRPLLTFLLWGQSQLRLCLLFLSLSFFVAFAAWNWPWDWIESEWQKERLTQREMDRTGERRGLSRRDKQRTRRRKADRQTGSQAALTFTPSWTMFSAQHTWLHLMWRDLSSRVFVCFYFGFTHRSVAISTSAHASVCVPLVLFTCWCLLVLRHVDTCTVCVCLCACGAVCACLQTQCVS